MDPLTFSSGNCFLNCQIYPFILSLLSQTNKGLTKLALYHLESRRTTPESTLEEWTTSYSLCLVQVHTLPHTKSLLNGILKEIKFPTNFHYFPIDKQHKWGLVFLLSSKYIKGKRIILRIENASSMVGVIFALLLSLTCSSPIRQMSKYHRRKVRRKVVLF